MDKDEIQENENNNPENKEDSNTNEKHDDDEGGVLITIVFYIFGFATLIGTNGMLNQLNFVEYFQKRINPFLTIVLLDNFSNIPLQLVILIKKKLFNLKKQLVDSLIILSICLIAFPFIVYLLKNNIVGNFLTILIAIIVGVIGSLLKSGFYALGSFFPLKNIVSFSTGQGVSGIIMALLGLLIRYAINSGDDEKDLRNGALVFFGFSLLLSLIALLSLFYIYKSKYGQSHIIDNEDKDKENDEKKVKEKTENDNHDAKEFGSERKIIHYKKEENIKSSENNNIIQQNKENSNSKGEISFWELFKLLKEVNFLIFYNYIIAYALYPYACKAQELFKSGEYRVNIIILLYSCCNTIGRYIMRFFKPTMRKTYVVILLRTIFIFTIIFNHYLYFSLKVNYNITSTLLVINIVLFGISNGFATSICMGIAPTLLKDEIKGKAGASVSFSLSIGSAIGSCLAFGVEKIMKNIGEL
jgi:hypothetical protein